MRRLIWAGIVALSLGLIVASCGGGSPTVTPAPEIHTVNGTFDLAIDCSVAYACAAGTAEGYADVVGGAQIHVSDETGTILGTGEMPPCQTKTVGTVVDCSSTWHIDGVTVAKFYSFEVSHRGKIVYSYDDMTKADWKVALSLGR